MLHALCKSMLVGVILPLLLAPSTLAGDATPARGEIAQWIKQLGNPQFAARERASEKLWDAGSAAEPELYAALQNDDPEIVRRAQGILEKFKWGIYPDTPTACVELVKQYQTAEPATKKQILARLLAKGSPAHVVLGRIARHEQDEELHKEITKLLWQEYDSDGVKLLLRGKHDKLETMLTMIMETGDESSVREYVAYVLLRDRFDAHAPLLQLRADLKKDVKAARVLAQLYRAKGDLARAAEVATRAQQADLMETVWLEQRSWKDLTKLHIHSTHPQKQIDALGVQATYQRLAGNQEAYEKAMTSIRELAKGKSASRPEPFICARLYLLNEQPEEALSVLREAGIISAAMDVQAELHKVREALSLAEEMRGQVKDSRQQFLFDAVAGRLYCTTGQQEKGRQLLLELTRQSSEPDKYMHRYGPLLSILAMELPELADSYGARLLAEAKDKKVCQAYMKCLFPKGTDAAIVCWQYLRKEHAGEKPEATMKRLRTLLDGKTPEADFLAVADKMEKASESLKPAERELWLRALGETCQVTGRQKRVRSYCEKAVKVADSIAAHVQLADAYAAEEDHKQAAEHYYRAFQQNARDSMILYLHGLSLIRAGQERKGNEIVELARLLSLGSPDRRYYAALNLEQRNYPDEARRERELILRIDNIHSEHSYDALRKLALDAQDRQMYLQAADYYERYLFSGLRLAPETDSITRHIQAPLLVRSNRARGLLEAGRVEAALPEIRANLKLRPSDANLLVAVVPELTKRGQGQEADRIFAQGSAAIEKLCADFPEYHEFHHMVAWTAVRCRRNLKEAQQHAARAVKLDPGNAQYRETLAETCFQQRDFEEALAHIKKCIKMEPRNDRFARQLTRFEKRDPAVEIPK